MLKLITKGVVYTVLGTILAGCYYHNSAYYDQNKPQNYTPSITRGQAMMSDQMITNQVRKRIGNRGFMGNRMSGNSSVNVMTKNGVVYLSGMVRTPQERSNIIRMASSLPGVKSVKSTLKISS